MDRHCDASSRALETRCLPSGWSPEETCHLGQLCTTHRNLIPTYDADVLVDRHDPLVGIFLQQLGCDKLLQCQHNPVFAPDADRSASILYRLDCIFDLEVSSIGGEDGIRQVITCAYRGLGMEISIELNSSCDL